MQVVCYGGCGSFEADDVETLSEMFIAHVRAEHQRQYPDASLRTFVRNFVDAVERTTGSTERLAEIGEITVHPVSADRIDDWLHLFDRDAFAGNPDWASCYCIEPHQPPTEEEGERPWHTNRQMMADRLHGGTAYGYLAYADGYPAGWVNASMRSDYAGLDGIEGPDAGTVVGVRCFVVAPPYRRHGVAAALLDRVIADAAGRGAAWIEAYPHDDADQAEESHHFRGVRSMFDARGFQAVGTVDRYAAMRRPAG